MADGGSQARPPSLHRLAGGRWGGFEADLFLTDPGRHMGVPQVFDRIVFHTGAPVRADCQCEGARQSGWQSRGDFDLVPAGATGVWEDESPAEILVFRASPERIAHAAQGLGRPPERARLAPGLRVRDPHVELIIWALKAEIETRTPGPSLYAESLGAALVSRLVSRHAEVQPQRPGGLTPRQLRQVVDLVEDGIDRDLGLAELAAAASVSVSHFTAMFRRTMGLSAHRYVVERRVLRAQALLARGKLPIADVAAATGFAHPSHLARWMRRVTGLTPSAFARAH